MVAPYTPKEEDWDKLYEDLPALGIGCEKISQTIKNNSKVIFIGAFFYFIFGLAKNNFCHCV